jgi:hypothetical protein
VHLPMATSLDHGDRPGGPPVATPGRERVIERSVGVPLARGARVRRTAPGVMEAALDG